MDNETDFFGWVLKIALGLFVGAVLVCVVLHHYGRYQDRQAVVAVNEFFHEMDERSRREAAAAREARQRQLERHADRQRRAAQAVRERQIWESAREAAWQRFYQPSALCLREFSVDCGNEHIRARREFDRRYAAGELN